MVALTLQDPLVQSYIVHAAILAMKILILGPLTGALRIYRGVFANQEDTAFTGNRGKIKFDDPVVERIRRAHLNDLENIPAFWILAVLYLTTGPAVTWATILFRVFTVGRIIHTIVYAIIPLPQPTRAIAFGVPALINFYMGIHVAIYYITAV